MGVSNANISSEMFEIVLLCKPFAAWCLLSIYEIYLETVTIFIHTKPSEKKNDSENWETFNVSSNCIVSNR